MIPNIPGVIGLASTLATFTWPSYWGGELLDDRGDHLARVHHEAQEVHQNGQLGVQHLEGGVGNGDGVDMGSWLRGSR